VLVATGYFSEDFAKEQLLPFALFLEENPFWKAQIEQVHVEQNGNVVLTPLVGDHLIELGNMQNYVEKLRNMKAFYEQVLVLNNWDKYQTISLKYKNQVIAKKK
jgi:cell division protein FtsQ